MHHMLFSQVFNAQKINKTEIESQDNKNVIL